MAKIPVTPEQQVDKDTRLEELEGNRIVTPDSGEFKFFSAEISIAGANVVKQFGTWIDTVTLNATGRLTLTFEPGTFSEDPIIVVSYFNPSNITDQNRYQNVMWITSVTASSCEVRFNYQDEANGNNVFAHSLGAFNIMAMGR